MTVENEKYLADLKKIGQSIILTLRQMQSEE